MVQVDDLLSTRKDKFRRKQEPPKGGHGAEDTEPLLHVSSVLETLLVHMGLTYQEKTRNNTQGNKIGWGGRK